MLFPRAHFIVLLTLVGLAACSESASDTPNTPDPPAKLDLTALVVGNADSPFLDVLTERTRMVQDDGSQKVVNYDLIIFDGDTHTPAALAEQPRLGEAVREGAWVLLADASEAHKREGLEPLLGLTTLEDTAGYLFRSIPGTAPIFDMVELSSMQEPAEDRAVAEEYRVQLRERHYRKFVDRIIGEVGNGPSVQQAGGCASPLDITAGIIFTTWCYSPSGYYDLTPPLVLDLPGFEDPAQIDPVIVGTYIRDVLVTPQAGENDVTYVLTLLLDNDDTITGDSQTLHVAVDGQMTPTTTTWPVGLSSELTGKPYTLGPWFLAADVPLITFGYMQSGLALDIGPVNGAETLLRPAANYQPQTPNNVQTDSYTSSTSFTISATLEAGATPDGATGGGGVSGSYTVSSSNTKTTTITDWTWTASASGDQGSSYAWSFTSQNPVEGMLEQGSEWDAGWMALAPNQLNVGLMQFDAEAVWTTASASAETADFQLSSTQQLVLPGQTGGQQVYLVDEQQQAFSQTVSLDLGTVIPVTLAPGSLSFVDAQGNPVTQENPVSAGETVTASVGLSGTAPFGYSITSTATSANNNAVITESPVQITRGDTSETFTLETNANGLTSGELVAVDVFLGSFGSTAAQQLWIVND